MRFEEKLYLEMKSIKHLIKRTRHMRIIRHFSKIEGAEKKIILLYGDFGVILKRFPCDDIKVTRFRDIVPKRISVNIDDFKIHRISDFKRYGYCGK